MNESVCELVRKAETNDTSGQTAISKYVQLSMREEIDKTDAYLNSKHTSGETDSMGRDKPFFNIVVAARNIWYRATDIDRNNIKLKATKAKQSVLAFLATIHLGEWMRRNGFGKFLNDWGLMLATYGSAISKFVEKDGELHCEVVSWNRMIVDPIDFDNNLKIEKLWLTPAQLKRRNYDSELVEKLLLNLTTRKTPDGQTQDTKSEYIPIYEVHGELSEDIYKYAKGLKPNKGDKDIYTEQMHVITFLAKKDKSNEYDDYTLYVGKEAKCPYQLAHLIKQDGYTLSGGAVKSLFEAQWMMNHNAKTIKDQLDLASKLIFQTSDGNFVGQNALNAIEQGDILIHGANQPLTLLNNKADIAALQSYGAQWKSLSSEQAGISESMLGVNPPSGTAWGLEEAKLRESHSLFELMTENKGLYLEEMLTEYIIPHLKKKMDTTEEISAILEDHQVTQLDSMYVPNEAIRRTNRMIAEKVLSDREVSPEEQMMMTQMETQNIQQGLSTQGNQRFIKPSDIPTKTWKELLKDFEWEVEVDITNEQSDTQAALTTLTTVLQTIATNPMVLQDPNMKLLFNRILEKTGAVSPIELSTIKPAMPVGQPVMAAGGVGAGQQQPVMK